MWKIITSSNNRMISAQNKSASNISVLRENQTLQPKHDTSLHYDKNNFLNLQFAPWYIGISTPALYNSIQSGTLQDAPEDIGAVPGIHNYKKHLCCPVKVPLCATCISSHQTPMFTWRCSIWKLEANYYIPVKPPHEVSLSKLQCLTLFSLLEKISSVKILREEQTNQHAQKYMRWAGGLSMLVHTCHQYRRWQGVSSKTQTGARHQKQR